MSRYSLYYPETIGQGQIYQANPRDIRSLPAIVQGLPEELYGPIPFGCPLKLLEINVSEYTQQIQGVYITSPQDLTSNIDEFIGISVFSNTCKVEDSNTYQNLGVGAAYFNKDVVSVLTKGKIWVKIAYGTNVKAGEKAFVFNNPSISKFALTEFTNDPTTTFINPPETVDNIEIGVFVTDKNEQNLAVLQFDLSANIATL